MEIAEIQCAGIWGVFISNPGRKVQKGRDGHGDPVALSNLMHLLECSTKTATTVYFAMMLFSRLRPSAGVHECQPATGIRAKPFFWLLRAKGTGFPWPPTRMPAALLGPIQLRMTGANSR